MMMWEVIGYENRAIVTEIIALMKNRRTGHETQRQIACVILQDPRFNLQFSATQNEQAKCPKSSII